MRLIVIFAVLSYTMPFTGLEWAEGSNVLLDPNSMCKKTRRLRGKLAEMCLHDSALLKEIISGINLGFRECEFQFRNRRWNCSPLRKSMRKLLMKDTREISYLNAITSAGVTYAVTKACTLGSLVECSCDKSNLSAITTNSRYVNAASLEKRKKLRKSNTSVKLQRSCIKKNENLKNRILEQTTNLPKGEWEWAGCSDNVNFGFKISRIFLDAKYRRRRDLRTLVKLHNNNAGRLAISNSMRFECKCHGLSGSCTMKTCWLKMAPFREVARQIQDKFNCAYKVTLRNDGNGFIPELNINKQPGKYDLVYTDDSPDFCSLNLKSGSIGTQGRQCNALSTAEDSCDILCCNRGYKHQIVSNLVNCKCVFKWCCEVTCEKCVEQREINTCL